MEIADMIDGDREPGQYKMIESTVIVKDDKGEIIKKYSLNVEIEMQRKHIFEMKGHPKAYLGGFRNGKNGVVLHHAFA